MVHLPLMFPSECREFPSAPCLAGKKKLDDSSSLDVVEIARVVWHVFFQSLWQEKTCNSAHEETPLSNDTIDSVLRHWEVVRAKDLSAPPLMSLKLIKYTAIRILRKYICFTFKNGILLPEVLYGFGSLVVSILATGTRVRGFKPGRSRWIFRASGKSSVCLPSERK